MSEPTSIYSGAATEIAVTIAGLLEQATWEAVRKLHNGQMPPFRDVVVRLHQRRHNYGDGLERHEMCWTQTTRGAYTSLFTWTVEVKEKQVLIQIHE